MLLMMLDDPLKAVPRPQLRPCLPPEQGRAADGLLTSQLTRKQIALRTIERNEIYSAACTELQQKINGHDSACTLTVRHELICKGHTKSFNDERFATLWPILAMHQQSGLIRLLGRQVCYPVLLLGFACNAYNVQCTMAICDCL